MWMLCMNTGIAFVGGTAVFVRKDCQDTNVTWLRRDYGGASGRYV